MELARVKSAYRRYAPIYNFIFGRIVNEGRRRAIDVLPQRPGDHILEVGVGTGISLGFYDRQVDVTGIDVSPEMLERARKKYPKTRFPNIRELVEMDAQDLKFPDNTFDGVVAMYVASVVPDPKEMMREMFRVSKPGAPILVVNHFASSRKALRMVEDRFAPLSNRLGFRPDFSMEKFLETIDASPESISSVNIGGYWKLVVFRKSPENSQPKPGSNGHGSNGHS